MKKMFTMSLISALYEVTILTSDMTDAGSNSAFYYTFVGTKGQTGEHLADNPGNDRATGRSDTWKISDDADIGEFKCLRIRMDGHGGWHINTVSNHTYKSKL